MATLTTSWQNVASYKFNPGTGFQCTFYLDAKYSSQNINNNTTTIQTRLNCTVNQGGGGGNGYRFALSYASTKEGSTYWTFATETISTGSTTITHNADGKKSVTLSASMRVNYTGLDNSMSATVTLPKINRIANVSSGTNFDDESNPTITFTNPANFNLVPYLNFYKGNTVAKRLERPSSKYSSPYVWEITDEEREELRQIFNDGSSFSVTEGLDTYNGTSNIGYSSVSKTFSIVNANPTFTYEVKETNEKAISVLGTSKALWFIENVSQPKITVNPIAYKHANISNVVITNGTNTESKTESPYEATLNAISGTSAILVTDSRGFSTSEIIERPLIPYAPVSINSFEFKRENPTSSNIILNAEFSYAQQTFNITENVPAIKWKLNEGEANTFPSDNLYPGENTYTETGYTTISSDNYTIDTEKNKIIIYNLKLENVLPYTEKGTLYLYIEDLLTFATDNMPVIRGIDVMDWGAHDVQINGDLYIADENRENAWNIGNAVKKLDIEKEKQVWINQNPSNNFSSQTINLNIENFDYDELEVMSYNHVNEKYEIYNIVQKLGKGRITDQWAGTVGVGCRSRIFSHNTESTIKFENANSTIGTTAAKTDNSGCVPIRIIARKRRIELQS